MTRTRFLILIAAAAFAIRLAALLALRDPSEGPSSQQAPDGVEFSRIAWHLVRGEGYVNEEGRPTAFRAPGFPLFLAGIYASFGRNYLLAHLAFCALGALSCLVTFGLALELLPEAWARVAALLGVFYLPHVYFATVFFSENLGIPCLGLGTWLFLRHLRTGATGSIALAGLCLGWATLIRPYALLLGPVWLLMRVRPRKGQVGESVRAVLTATAVLMASWLAVVLPWALRNQVVLGRPALATNGGSTFYGGNNDRVLNEPGHYGAWLSTTELPDRDVVDAAPDEIARDQIEWRLGQDWVRSHLGALPKLLTFKFARLWLPEVESPNRLYTRLQIVGYTPFLVLFVLGAIRCARDRTCWTTPWLTLHLTIAATVFTALFFWGSPRFRDANMPLLMVYAALGWETAVPSLLRRVGFSLPFAIKKAG